MGTASFEVFSRQMRFAALTASYRARHRAGPCVGGSWNLDSGLRRNDGRQTNRYADVSRGRFLVPKERQGDPKRYKTLVLSFAILQMCLLWSTAVAKDSAVALLEAATAGRMDEVKIGRAHV